MRGGRAKQFHNSLPFPSFSRSSQMPLAHKKSDAVLVMEGVGGDGELGFEGVIVPPAPFVFSNYSRLDEEQQHDFRRRLFALTAGELRTVLREAAATGLQLFSFSVCRVAVDPRAQRGLTKSEKAGFPLHVVCYGCRPR